MPLHVAELVPTTNEIILGSFLQGNGIVAPALSAAGTGRLIFNTATNTFQSSQNGGAYADISGGGATLNSAYLAGSVISISANLRPVTINNITGRQSELLLLSNDQLNTFPLALFEVLAGGSTTSCVDARLRAGSLGGAGVNAEIEEPLNPSIALRANTVGLGRALFARSVNPLSVNPTFEIITSTSGVSMQVDHTSNLDAVSVLVNPGSELARGLVVTHAGVDLTEIQHAAEIRASAAVITNLGRSIVLTNDSANLNTPNGPITLRLRGGTGAVGIEFTDGQFLGVAAPNEGRIRYNNLTQQFEKSIDTGPYNFLGTSLQEAYDDGGAGLGRIIDISGVALPVVIQNLTPFVSQLLRIEQNAITTTTPFTVLSGGADIAAEFDGSISVGSDSGLVGTIAIGPATGTAATSGFASGIAIGNGAATSGAAHVVLGTGSHSGTVHAGVVIGDSVTTNDGDIYVGNGFVTLGLGHSVGIGIFHTFGAASSSSIAIGDSCSSTALNTAAIGTAALAQADFAIAIGTSAQVLAGSSEGISIGRGAAVFAGSPGAISIGDNALVRVAAGDSITIGAGAECAANFINSIAIGRNAYTEGISGLSIGDGASNSGLRSIGIGRFAGCADADSLAIGNNAFCSFGIDQIAIGHSAGSLSDRTIAIGFNTSGFGQTNICIGDSASNVGDFGIAIGQNARSGGQGGIAIGVDSDASDDSISIGNIAICNSDLSVCIGLLAECNGSQSIAIGQRSLADESFAIALGTLAICSNAAFRAMAIGPLAQATAADAIAIGQSCVNAVAGTARIHSNAVSAFRGLLLGPAVGPDNGVGALLSMSPVTVSPSGAGAGVIYVDLAGGLSFKGTAGTVTSLAPA